VVHRVEGRTDVKEGKESYMAPVHSTYRRPTKVGGVEYPWNDSFGNPTDRAEAFHSH